MEPWDGPASIAFTDGIRIGAVLDRNGLRPVALLRHQGRPGRHGLRGRRARHPAPSASCRRAACSRAACSWSTPSEGRIIADEEIKQRDRHREALRRSGCDDNLVTLRGAARGARRSTSPTTRPCCSASRRSATRSEDLKLLLAPMAQRRRRGRRLDGQRHAAGGALGAAAAPLQLLQAALRPGDQPAGRRIREEIIMAMDTTIGPERNLLEPTPAVGAPDQAADADPDERGAGEAAPPRRQRGSRGFKIDHAADRSSRSSEGGEGLEARMEELCARGQQGDRRRLRHHHPLRPRHRRASSAPIPALLAVAAVHHHLIREGTRTQVGLVLESGEPREVHHFALLIGYGAGAINPYLAFETLDDMIRQGLLPGVDDEHAVKNYVKAVNKGVVKVMSKMGISTDPELLRRPDLRGHRPRPGRSSTSTSPGRRRASAASAST